MVEEVIFEDPPERNYALHKQGKYISHRVVAEILKGRPTRWGIVGRYANVNSSSAMADQIRKGQITAYSPKGAFDAVARTVEGEDDKEYRVYARFMGTPE